MRRVKIAELKDRLSEHLRAVEGGEEIVVTHRDRPIARLIPFSSEDHRARIVPPSRPFSTIARRRYPQARWPVSSTELLLEERGDR